jgi:hypothetical protein
MADYTNYSIVSWADTTPITSVRLNQMSINIDQVKIVNDDKPRGILKLATIANNVTNTSNAQFANTKIIALTQETIGNVAYDNRVTIQSSRYYRMVLNFPGISQDDPGGEDSTYYLRFRKGNTAGSGDIIAAFVLNSGVATFLNTATTVANSLTIANNLAVRGDIAFGAGTYEYIIANQSLENQSYFVEIQRTQGGASGPNNASNWTVLASSGALQFYIEDAGGIA